MREIFGLSGVRRNLIRHLRLDKLNQRGALPLRLPGELSRRQPLDRFNRRPYPKPLNPLPRPCNPPRVRQPHPWLGAESVAEMDLRPQQRAMLVLLARTLSLMPR